MERCYFVRVAQSLERALMQVSFRVENRLEEKESESSNNPITVQRKGLQEKK